MLDLILGALGLCLVVVGVALVSVPAALIVAGLGLLALATFFDIKPLKLRGRGTK